MSPPVASASDTDLQGVEAAAAAFDRARASGRLHHAWLLTGPEGLGKASFAHRAARLLLGATPDARFGPLGSSPDDSVARLIAAQAHPDLLVLERRVVDGKLKKGISVDDARLLPEFFSKTPALAPYRVAVIDSADDLNVNAANAVLKTLEEPSGRGVLLLVSHQPARLLATVRSRCRTLRFAPWSPATLAAFLQARLGLDAPDAGALARLARGAPGRALSLHEQGALDLDRRIGEVLAKLPQSDPAALLALTDRFRGGEGPARFDLTLSLVADQVRGIAAALQPPQADGWAQAWQRLTALAPEVEALNLDRADAFTAVLHDLRRTARAHPAPC